MEGRYESINNLPNHELIEELIRILEEKFQQTDRVFVFNIPDHLKDLFKDTFGNYVERPTFEAWVQRYSPTEVPRDTSHLGNNVGNKNFQISESFQDNFQPPKSFQDARKLLETNNYNFQQLETDSVDTMKKAIMRVITNDIIDRPYKIIPFYVLLIENRELSAHELKELMVQYAKKLGMEISQSSLKYALTAVNKSTAVWKRKDEVTGMRYYKLTDNSRLKILETYALLRQAEKNVQKYSTSGDREETTRAFINFFRDYMDDAGKRKYIEELTKLVTEKNNRSLRVDWTELNSISPQLAEMVLRYPEKAIYSAEDAVQVILREDLFEEEPPHFHVCFVNLPTTLSPREVRSKHIGKLVQIRGVVSAIAEGERTNGVKGFIEKAVFVCNDCGNEMVRLQRPYENFVVPQKCDACGSRNIELDIEKSTIVDMREIFVQDPSDALHAAGTASYVRVILLDDNARMDVNPGDEVLITGIVRGVMRKKNGKPALGWVLEANSLTKLTKDIENLEITPSDIEQFKRMVQDPEFDLKLVRSLAPAITGREVEKKAVLLALFSGEDYDIEGTHVRKRSHVLLFGDAGTGKSEIIRHAAQIAPGGVHSTGTHSSGVGLTAAIDTMDGVRVLRAGVLVLADRGVAALDELDKMKSDDYEKMLDALEQGWFPYNKGGFNTRLMARAVVIAAANPPGGEFDKHNYRPFDELKRLFDQPFYSRFDLIIPVFKDEDEDTLEKIAEAVLCKHTGDIKPPYSSETLTKFIAYAKRSIPRVSLSPALKDSMKKHMIKLARIMGSAAPRVMEAIIRLTEAHARMHLRREATLSDFFAAMELFDVMITRLAGSPNEDEKEEVMKGLIGVIWTEEKKRKVDKLWSILKYYEALDETEEGVHINNIIEEAKQHGISQEEVILLLGDMERENMVERTKPGFYRLKRRG